MKRILLTATLLVGCVSVALAQRTVLKANIFNPLVKSGSFFLEHRLNEQRSLQLGGLFTRWSIGDTRLSGFAITPEYRFYLSEKKPALRGFYLGPFLRYQNLTLTTDYDLEDDTPGSTAEAQAALNTLGGGVVVGHQWLFKQRFSLDLFLGPSYNGGTIRVRESNSGMSADFEAGPLTGFGVRTGGTFGVAF